MQGRLRVIRPVDATRQVGLTAPCCQGSGSRALGAAPLDAADVTQHLLKSLAVTPQVVVLVLGVEPARMIQRVQAVPSEVLKGSTAARRLVLSSPQRRPLPAAIRTALLAVELYQPRADRAQRLPRQGCCLCPAFHDSWDPMLEPRAKGLHPIPHIGTDGKTFAPQPLLARGP